MTSKLGMRKLLTTLRVVAYACLGIAAIAFAVSLLGRPLLAIAASPLVFIAGVILLRACYRARQIEDIALLNALAIAAEEHTPLVEMVRAFAAEHRTIRLARLETALLGGSALNAALRNSRFYPPAAVRAVLAVAETRGDLGPQLRRALEPLRSLDRTLKTLHQRLILWLIGFAAFLIASTMYMRSFQKMFYEFGLKLPEPTYVWFQFAETWIIPFRVPLFGLIAAVLLYSLLVRDVPGLLPLFCRRRYDAAVILHAFAGGVKSNVPTSQTMASLAETYGVGGVTCRLRAIVDDINRGGELWESFRRCGLISAREATALRAAEQAGNLAYVLEELSRALLRRLDHRVSWWTSVIAPLGTAFLGCGVGFTAIGMILPLISLIQGLSGG